MTNTWLSWSTGKDSAWAYEVLARDPHMRITGLLTTLNSNHDRVAMHAVRRELVRTQAERLGLPLYEVDLPWPCPNEVYETLMTQACAAAVEQGVTHIAFGDLFLEDVRAYRERQLAQTPLRPVFPLWQRPTAELAREMIAAGLEARITCVDTSKLDAAFAGRNFDLAFLNDLPPHVDPCGENGEFHTFVHNTPSFAAPIAIRNGELHLAEGFCFADVLQV